MSPEEMRHYSRALDEIYHLRRLCADQARVIEADLTYKTFPKSRRAVAEERVVRLRKAAKGRWPEAIAGRPSRILDGHMKALGMKTTLTRAQYEQEATR